MKSPRRYLDYFVVHSSSTTAIHHIIITFLAVQLYISLVDGFSCVQKCSCIHTSNKLTASCDNLGLDSLPQCDKLNQKIKSKLDDIQVINLTHNHFTELTPNFFHNACLDNLQKIYLSQVSLQIVDNEAFKPLINVVELTLSSNLLQEIPTKAFEHLVRLQNLDLSFNHIKEVSNNSFKSLVNLRKLLLNNNGINFIDTNSFNGLQALNTLNLAGNNLKLLRPESFNHMRYLHTLYLEGNEWNCNCRMQPFIRMLLLKQKIAISDNPKCSFDTLDSKPSTSVIWSHPALDNFQCAPKILRNLSNEYVDTEVTVSEGSILKLKCATFTQTFGDNNIDEDYLSFSKINWYWNDVLITNFSKGADANSQHFQINEYFQEYNSSINVKVSNLTLFSIMTFNEGTYRCSVVNSAGSDEMKYQVFVIPYFSNNYFDNSNKIIPAASSSESRTPYNKNIVNSRENSDHILFGLVLGILCGLFIVLVIFSMVLVVFFRKPKVIHQPHELAIVDASTDNNTVDDNQDTNTETTEKLNSSQTEFNPLLVVNPVQKPPRLGIPDVSSIYSHPSWTMNRANYNRSRYASYAETEPIYSDYYTLLRPNRHVARMENGTFISDTASEV